MPFSWFTGTRIPLRFRFLGSEVFRRCKRWINFTPMECPLYVDLPPPPIHDDYSAPAVARDLVSRALGWPADELSVSQVRSGGHGACFRVTRTDEVAVCFRLHGRKARVLKVLECAVPVFAHYGVSPALLARGPGWHIEKWEGRALDANIGRSSPAGEDRNVGAISTRTASPECWSSSLDQYAAELGELYARVHRIPVGWYTTTETGGGAVRDSAGAVDSDSPGHALQTCGHPEHGLLSTHSQYVVRISTLCCGNQLGQLVGGQARELLVWRQGLSILASGKGNELGTRVLTSRGGYQRRFGRGTSCHG